MACVYIVCYNFSLGARVEVGVMKGKEGLRNEPVNLYAIVYVDIWVEESYVKIAV